MLVPTCIRPPRLKGGDRMAWNNEAILGRERPNFFELLAEEQLRESLRPALVYLTKVLARACPHWFSPLWKSRDEIHLLLDLAVQTSFLKLRDSLFSENFYSLKRVVATTKRQTNSRRNLNVPAVTISLIFSVLVPYLKVKLERLYSKLIHENDNSGISWQTRGQSAKQFVKYVLFISTPYLQSLWMLVNFIFRIRYLMLSSAYYSPLHWLANVKLVHNSQQYEAGFTEGVWPWLAGQLLSLSLFSLRLLQWWYSGENEVVVRKMATLPIPPPPPPPHQSNTAGDEVLGDTRHCPLCKQRRNEPTVLSSSGYVYCYDCIHRHLQQEEDGRCPVSLLPSSTQQLIKLHL